MCGYKLAVLFCITTLLGGIFPVRAQESARYEDSIEQARKKIFTPDGRFREDLLPVEQEKAPINPFDIWHKPKEKPPLFRFHADVIATRRNIHYWENGSPIDYKELDALADFYLSLPPPPQPPPTIHTNTVWVTPSTEHLYQSLLQFLQAGPGPNGVGTVGTLIQVDDLQKITPSLLSLATIITPTSTTNQVLSTPQGALFLSTAQSILQPLGMWNLTTLQAWVNYISPQFGTLLTLVSDLQTQLLAVVPLPNTVTTVIPSPPINPIATIIEINRIFKDGSNEEIAEKIPKLAHSLIGHVGYTEPMIVIYGSKKGGSSSDPWPYKVGIVTERRDGDTREVHVLNEEGYFINEYASGSSLFYQGSDDASMVYVPVLVEDGRVRTLDVVATDRYALLKRMAGGDVTILDKVPTFSSSLISFDVALLKDRSLHVRPVAGVTPHSSMGGLMLNVEYGEKDELFYGRIGGGAVFENVMFDKSDNFLGYLETENVLRTPYLSYVDSRTETGIRSWASLTLAASGMAHRAVSGVDDSHWGFQAEARVIPEVHAQLATEKVCLTLYGGFTLSVVPGGHLDLEHPERTLGLRYLRNHIGFNAKYAVSDKLLCEMGIVSEFSSLVDKTRLELGLTYRLFQANLLIETETYKNTSFTDVRLGGGIAYHGFFVTAVRSVKDGDYRVEAGLDVTSFSEIGALW